MNRVYALKHRKERGYRYADFDGERYPYVSEEKLRLFSANRPTVPTLLLCVLLLAVGFAVSAAFTHLSYPRRFEEIVCANCRCYGVDESLVYAVIRTESGFDPEAKSNVGALGLMQITPETFHWLQSKIPDAPSDTLDDNSLFDPEINIRYGVFFLSMLQEEFGSDTLAIAAYHAGRGQVSSWLEGGTLEQDSKYSDIPSGATGHYVNKVERARTVYIQLYYDSYSSSEEILYE